MKEDVSKHEDNKHQNQYSKGQSCDAQDKNEMQQMINREQQEANNENHVMSNQNNIYQVRICLLYLKFCETLCIYVCYFCRIYPGLLIFAENMQEVMKVID